MVYLHGWFFDFEAMEAIKDIDDRSGVTYQVKGAGWDRHVGPLPEPGHRWLKRLGDCIYVSVGSRSGVGSWHYMFPSPHGPHEQDLNKELWRLYVDWALEKEFKL